MILDPAGGRTTKMRVVARALFLVFPQLVGRVGGAAGVRELTCTARVTAFTDLRRDGCHAASAEDALPTGRFDQLEERPGCLQPPGETRAG